MQRLFIKFLILYSVVITAILLKLLSEQTAVVTLTQDRPITKIIEKEVVRKEIVYREPKTQKETRIEESEVGLEDSQGLTAAAQDPLVVEREEKQQEINHETSSEKMLAFFEQAVGINLTPEQEQKALSALRAYDEADVTAVADADTAFLDRKLDLSDAQQANIRKAITEFRYEPEVVSEEIATNEVQQIESQNQAFYDQVSPLLDEKQKAELLNMMNQGTTFVDE